MALTRTVVTVEVLSDGPLPAEWGLADLSFMVIEGGMSGMVLKEEAEEVSRTRMAELLIAQSSDPEFLLGSLDDDDDDDDHDDDDDDYPDESR